MTARRGMGWSMVALGAVLAGMYAGPTLYGAAMAQGELARFRAGSSTTADWNRTRLKAYRHLLRVSFPTPEAVLRMPRLGLEVPVLEGTSDMTLTRGVGHIPGTALPGERGNVGIAGHRDGFFRRLKDASVGDVIEVQERTGARRDSTERFRTERYMVRKILVVSPEQTSVLKPSTASSLTLVTCYPFYYVGAAPQRYVVQADLLPESNMLDSKTRGD